jgi:hypothetical protein
VNGPGGPAEIFQHWLERTPVVKKRMANARLVGAMQTTSDFSYFNRRLVSQRTLRIGDAAGFMDPIFSAGVYLAMWSGKLAAEVVQNVPGRGDDGARDCLKFERRVRAGMQFYWQMVEHYYTTPFMELFLQPSNHAGLSEAVNAVLAGELEGGWKFRWRLALLFLPGQIAGPPSFGPAHLFRSRRPRPRPGDNAPVSPQRLNSWPLILVVVLCAGCGTPFTCRRSILPGRVGAYAAGPGSLATAAASAGDGGRFASGHQRERRFLHPIHQDAFHGRHSRGLRRKMADSIRRP